MAVTQLKLVQDKAPDANITTDPTRVVFDRWVFMFGLHQRRTKLDALRRQVINAALALYDQDLETILLAVDGMAAAPLADKPDSMREAMREIDWFLGNAKRIEQCLRWNDRLRLQLEREQAAADAPQDDGPSRPEPTPEQVAAQREALRQMAARMAGRDVARGAVHG